MKLPVLAIATLITFSSVTPAQAESPLARGIFNGIINTTIGSQSRHHAPHRSRRAYRHSRHQRVNYSHRPRHSYHQQRNVRHHQRHQNNRFYNPYYR